MVDVKTCIIKIIGTAVQFMLHREERIGLSLFVCKMRVITFISTNLGEIKAINIFIRIQIP